MDDLFVVDRSIVGQALLPSGERYDVVATRHNRDWPGTNTQMTFAVELYGWINRTYGVIRSWGFFRERDCYDFLTSFGERRYEAYDRNGRIVEESRVCRAIPDAYVRRSVYEL